MASLNCMLHHLNRVTSCHQTATRRGREREPQKIEMGWTVRPLYADTEFIVLLECVCLRGCVALFMLVSLILIVFFKLAKK